MISNNIRNPFHFLQTLNFTDKLLVIITKILQDFKNENTIIVKHGNAKH
jgi:hypothetical protein